MAHHRKRLPRIQHQELREWQIPEYFSRHERLVPALDARPYIPYWRRPEYQAQMIHTAGAVTEPPVSWIRSPQVRVWLDQPKPSIWQRIVEWLNEK